MVSKIYQRQLLSYATWNFRNQLLSLESGGEKVDSHCMLRLIGNYLSVNPVEPVMVSNLRSFKSRESQDRCSLLPSGFWKLNADAWWCRLWCNDKKTGSFAWVIHNSLGSPICVGYGDSTKDDLSRPLKGNLFGLICLRFSILEANYANSDCGVWFDGYDLYFQWAICQSIWN